MANSSKRTIFAPSFPISQRVLYLPRGVVIAVVHSLLEVGSPTSRNESLNSKLSSKRKITLKLPSPSVYSSNLKVTSRHLDKQLRTRLDLRSNNSLSESISKRRVARIRSLSKVRFSPSTSLVAEHPCLRLSPRYVPGLVLIGAKWESSQLSINNGENVRLSSSSLVWSPTTTASSPSSQPVINIPLFLDATRSDLLLSVQLPKGNVDQTLLSQRSVALIAASD